MCYMSLKVLVVANIDIQSVFETVGILLERNTHAVFILSYQLRRYLALLMQAVERFNSVYAQMEPGNQTY